mmetsp:Transcript_26428/g.47659  ORF Transcript_26428/g.47659 Transcript_26428/m.47659 type:complete len:90 (-) Transcript_26428:310-579(-)
MEVLLQVQFKYLEMCDHWIDVPNDDRYAAAMNSSLFQMTLNLPRNFETRMVIIKWLLNGAGGVVLHERPSKCIAEELSQIQLDLEASLY